MPRKVLLHKEHNTCLTKNTKEHKDWKKVNEKSWLEDMPGPMPSTVAVPASNCVRPASYTWYATSPRARDRRSSSSLRRTYENMSGRQAIGEKWEVIGDWGEGSENESDVLRQCTKWTYFSDASVQIPRISIQIESIYVFWIPIRFNFFESYAENAI